jgi:hypothetical protein
MVATWTSEQVLALAPDSASAKNGKGLATPSKWRSLGKSSQAVWGECQGSGKDPYRTQIDLGEPAFRCSCPSRKFPCKHGLALFLLLVEQSGNFQDAEPPVWVSDWLVSRSQREEKQKQKLEQSAPAANPAAQAKRAAERHRKVTAGVQELQLWLTDLIRQGLAVAQTKPYSFWEQPAARAIDAQAPGLARMLREMAGIPHSGVGWTERLLEQLGKLHILIEGFQRLESLPVDIQADIRTQIGWAQDRVELLVEEREQSNRVMRDCWLVLGQSVEEEEKLRVSRSWLWGRTSDRSALILQFAYGNQPFDLHLMPGSTFEAELVFFESAYPLRALIKTRSDVSTSLDLLPGCEAIDAAIAAYINAIARNPWLERFPMSIQNVIPIQIESAWSIRDRAGKLLPIPNHFERNWSLLALSGGHPITIFGEWNGRYFSPLSIWTNQEFYPI